MKLALRLGRTVPELLACMSSAELTEWRAFNMIEPIGDERIDFGFGIVAAQIVNSSGKTLKAGAAPAKPIDFMPLAQKQKISLAQQVRAIFSKLASTRKKE